MRDVICLLEDMYRLIIIISIKIYDIFWEIYSFKLLMSKEKWIKFNEFIILKSEEILE